MFTFLDDLQDLSVFKCWLFFFFLMQILAILNNIK